MRLTLLFTIVAFFILPSQGQAQDCLSGICSRETLHFDNATTTTNTNSTNGLSYTPVDPNQGAVDFSKYSATPPSSSGSQGSGNADGGDRNAGGGGSGAGGGGGGNGQQASGAGGGSSYDQCVMQAQSLIDECSTKHASTMSNCDTSGNSSLTGMMGTASQMTTSMSSATPSASGSCSSMGMLGAGAQAALSAYQGSCSSAKNSCVEKCTAAKTAMVQCASRAGQPLASIQSTAGYIDANNNYNTCNAQQAKVDQAGSAIANMMSETQKAKECAAQAAAMNTPSSDPNSAYCKAHPTVASCILDCNHPSMVSNQTCICMKNPYDTSCGRGSSAGQIAGDMSASGGGVSASTSSAAPNLTGGDGFDPDRLMEIGNASRRATAGQVGEEVGGKQGGSAGLGSSGGGNGSSPSKAGGNAASDPRAAAGGGGFYGAGGGSGGGWGGSNGSGDGNGSAYAGVAGAGGLPGQRTPDLKQFLPGGRMDPAHRGIAGMTGVDGISGPNETNWTKMQRRYRFLESTFLP